MVAATGTAVAVVVVVVVFVADGCCCVCSLGELFPLGVFVFDCVLVVLVVVCEEVEPFVVVSDLTCSFWLLFLPPCCCCWC